MRWRDGVLVTSAPDILYLEDTDGDGRADVRRVVLTGFSATNPQLRVNGLRYGVDNWIYANYPRVIRPRKYVDEFGHPGDALRFPDHPDAPPLDIRAEDVRFRPDGARLEALGGVSQFGNFFDHWGNRFTTWNNDYVRHLVIESRYLKQNPYLAVEKAYYSPSGLDHSAPVYPVTENPLHIHDSQIGHFTSSCGLSGRGLEIFRESCAECHRVGDLGHEVGPDLLSLTTRYKEVFLADILMPNQSVETGFEEYLVNTVDGRSLSGIIAKETPTTVTIRRAKGEEDTILRGNVKSMYSLSVSPMPEDLEETISVQDMADLIAYLKALGT